MRILQVCLRVPFPPKDGGAIAMHTLTQGFINNNSSVKVLAINTPKHFVHVDQLPKEYVQATAFESVFVDTSLSIRSAIKNILSKESYNISRFYSKEFEDKVRTILQTNSFDIIQLESLFVTPYIDVIKQNTSAKIVLRTHNVEHIIWEQLAANTKNPFKKIYLQFLATRLKHYESEVLKKVDALVNITKEDSVVFNSIVGGKHSLTLPFGLDLLKYDSTLKLERDKELSLFHLGAMDWLPNQEAVMWFLNNCWNQLSITFPTLKFYIAGRNIPDWFYKLNYKNVEVVGEVDEATIFMHQHHIMIVPLFSGSGMRTKIIEGMCIGNLIISTTLGINGIDAVNGTHYLKANTADEFVQQITYSIQHQVETQRIIQNARQLIEQKYDNAILIKKLLQFYAQLS